MNGEKRLSSIEKRQLLIFIIAAYGFTFLMGLPLGIAYKLGLDTYPFPNAQMFYPAAGVMLACLITKRRPGGEGTEESAAMPKGFFIFFVVFTALMALCCFVNFALPSGAGTGTALQSYGMIGGSALAWVPVALHFINNNLAVAVSGTTQLSGYAIGWMDVLVSLVINAVIFLPFLAAKVFRKGPAEKQKTSQAPPWERDGE